MSKKNWLDSDQIAEPKVVLSVKWNPTGTQFLSHQYQYQCCSSLLLTTSLVRGTTLLTSLRMVALWDVLKGKAVIQRSSTVQWNELIGPLFLAMGQLYWKSSGILVGGRGGCVIWDLAVYCGLDCPHWGAGSQSGKMIVHLSPVLKISHLDTACNFGFPCTKEMWMCSMYC